MNVYWFIKAPKDVLIKQNKLEGQTTELVQKKPAVPNIEKVERDPNKLAIAGSEPGMVWEEIKPTYNDQGSVIF